MLTVQAWLNGRSYWIDATASLQRGALAQRYNPNYGRALVLRDGSRELEEIPQQVTDEPTTTVREVYTVEDYRGAALLEVISTYHDVDADAMRGWIAQQTLSDLGKSYLNYYAEIDPAIEAKGVPQVSDDPSTNTLVVVEEYKISNFWKNKQRQFFAGRIDEGLGKPGISKRSTPLALTYPSCVRQTIEAHLPEHYSIERDSGTVANDAINFKYQYGSIGNTITLDYQLRTLRNHVSAGQISKHLETVARIRKSLGYEISRDGWHADSNIVSLVPFLLVVAPFLIFGVFKLVKRTRSRHRQSEFKQRFRLAPGQAPETAIQLNQRQNINQSLYSMRCSCGAGYDTQKNLPETESAIFDGRRLTIVRVRCEACTQFQDIYFAFPDAATGH